MHLSMRGKKGFYLHAADPLLYRARPHRGRWYRGKEISEATRWVRCYSSIGGATTLHRPWSNSTLSLGSRSGGCPGSYLGESLFVPFVPFAPGAEASIFPKKKIKKRKFFPPHRCFTTPPLTTQHKLLELIRRRVGWWGGKNDRRQACDV